MRDPAGWWANIGFAVCGESVSTCFTIYPSVVSSCGWLTPFWGDWTAYLYTHTHLHRLGTNCCFPRNFIKSIGDYKLVPSCVCWLILLPLTVISLHTVKGQSRSDSLLLSPYHWAKLFGGAVAIVAVPMRFAVICWIVLEAFVGQIHVFPLGSWMTIQVLGLSRISFWKSYREAVRLEKVQASHHHNF